MEITTTLTTDNTHIGHGLNSGTNEGCEIVITADAENGDVTISDIVLATNKGDTINVTALFEDFGIDKKILALVDWDEVIEDYEVGRNEEH